MPAEALCGLAVSKCAEMKQVAVGTEGVPAVVAVVLQKCILSCLFSSFFL